MKQWFIFALLCSMGVLNAKNFVIKNTTKHELCLIIDWQGQQPGHMVVVGPRGKAEFPENKKINNFSIMSRGKYKKFNDIKQNGSGWKGKMRHVYNISGPTNLKGKIIIHKTKDGLQVNL